MKVKEEKVFDLLSERKERKKEGNRDMCCVDERKRI